MDDNIYIYIILKDYSPLLHSEKTQHKGLPNAIKNDVKYVTIIERKSYTFKNLEKKFKINKDLSCNSKTAVCIIECSKCKVIYIGSTQAHKKRISLHKSNIKITENRKLNVSKHLYECSQGQFKIMPIYQTNDYTLLQIKEKNIDRFKPKFNKTWIILTHKWTQTYIDIYIYMHT